MPISGRAQHHSLFAWDIIIFYTRGEHKKTSLYYSEFDHTLLLSCSAKQKTAADAINFCLPPEGQEGVNLGAVVVLVLLGIISLFIHI